MKTFSQIIATNSARETELRGLELRLMCAVGPDRELDEILHKMMPEPKVIVPLRYTRSVDDAVEFTLAMIPGAFWCVEYLDIHWGSVSTKAGPRPRDTVCEGATGGLALCRAAVKAMLLIGARER